MTDLMNGMKYLDERIDNCIDYILNQYLDEEEKVDMESLFDFGYDIVDEWVADMNIYTYIHDELKEKLNKKGIRVEI